MKLLNSGDSFNKMLLIQVADTMKDSFKNLLGTSTPKDKELWEELNATLDIWVSAIIDEMKVPQAFMDGFEDPSWPE